MTNEGTLERSRLSRGAERRQRLLDTARNLFVEKGFHQTGMAQIASASGIAVGQIYRDFANKEAIVAAISEANVGAWLQEESLAAALSASDKEALRAWMARVMCDPPPCQNRRLMCEMLAEVGHSPSIAAVHQEADDKLRARLDAVLQVLAPSASHARRSVLVNLMLAVTWGRVARMELAPVEDHDPLHAYASALLMQEVANLEN